MKTYCCCLLLCPLVIKATPTFLSYLLVLKIKTDDCPFLLSYRHPRHQKTDSHFTQLGQKSRCFLISPSFNRSKLPKSRQ